MANGPQISVVILTYNAANYLAASIGSALAQTFTDFELLILDNASTDETPQVVAQFNDPRIQYHRNERNLGFAGNANVGLKRARGQYITYLGADDIWNERFLARCIDLLRRNSSLALVHTAATWIDPSGAPFGANPPGWSAQTPGPAAFLHALRYGFTFAAMVMRIDLLRRVGPIDESWKGLADSWIFLKLCLAGDVGYIADPLVLYRVHDQSISLAMYSDGSYAREHLRVVREAFDWPCAVAAGLQRYRRRGLRDVARDAIRPLHLRRLSSTRRQFLQSFGRIVKEAPGVLLLPEVWARVAFGMLPQSLIRRLRSRRRRAPVVVSSPSSAPGVV